MTNATPESAAAFQPAQGDLIATAGRYYRYARYLICGLLLFFGVWCFYNGYFTYPADNQAEIDRVIKANRESLKPGETLSKAQIDRITSETVPKHDTKSIWLNKIFAILFPPGGIAFFFWTRYNSRGEYRLSGNTLYIPGHPPIPLEAIHRIDQTLWDRKGIARIEYELPNGVSGRATLDDFVYQEVPTRAIMERLEQYAAHRADSAGQK